MMRLILLLTIYKIQLPLFVKNVILAMAMSIDVCVNIAWLDL